MIFKNTTIKNTLLAGLLTMTAQQAISLTLPFEVGETWRVCQGYNGNISHSGNLELSLDLSIDSNSVGANGCTTHTSSSSNGESVISPASGKVQWVGSTDNSIMCISFKEDNFDRSMKVGHINASLEAGDQIREGETVLGTLRNDTDRLSGYYAHIHIQKFSGSNCSTGSAIAIGNSFAGYDLSSNGSVNQHSGLSLTRNANSSSELTEREKASLVLSPLVYSSDIKFDSNSLLDVVIQFTSYSPIDELEVILSLYDSNKQTVHQKLYKGTQGLIVQTGGFSGAGFFTSSNGEKIRQKKYTIVDSVANFQPEEIRYARLFLKNKSACKLFGDEDKGCSFFSIFLPNLTGSGRLSSNNIIEAGESRYIIIE